LARAIPEWVIDDLFTDDDLGVIATGKEGEVNLIERTSIDTGHSILLARKRYRPRTVTHKGELKELGFERAPTFRNDIVYRDGRNYGRRSRDRRAVESMTKYGKELVKSKWSGHEFDVMRAVWDEGGPVPYPLSCDEDNGLILEYIGDRAQAAPRLAQARLSPSELREAWTQLVDALHAIVRAGWVHSDLSAYNVLWWHGELFVIDLPQAVDLAISPHGFEFLHRDVCNVATWFTRHGVDVDPDALYGELLADL
jgi:RIO kinase 1